MTRPRIGLFKVYMAPPEELDKRLLDVVHSGWIGQCTKNAEFEKMLQDYIGNPYGATVSSATVGIHLAYRLMDIEPGDEIITTPATCFCAQCPALQERAKLVWADIDPATMNIDPMEIWKAITPRTKAVYVVHWGGYPADMEAILDVAEDHGLYVLADCAHAFGATYKGKPIGTCEYSDFDVFSFQAIKQLTTADGGIVFCRDPAAWKRAKLLRWYGIDREGPRGVVRCEEEITEYGYKYHMNDIASILGIVNLAHVKENNAIAQENADYYRRELAGVDGLTLTQTNLFGRTSANWLFTIHVEKRAAFVSHMENHGIDCNQVHARNDTKIATAAFRKQLPATDWVYEHMVCIPVGWWVTKEDREYVVDTIKRGW